MDDLGFFLFLSSMSAILVVSGVMAYRGKYVMWLALKSFFPGWVGLASLYLGIAFMGLSIFMVLEELDILHGPIMTLIGLAMAGATFVCLPIGIIGFFWLPRFMLPKWIKETEERIARGEDKLSQALRPGGSLYGRWGQPGSNAPHRRVDGDGKQIE
ncbi:hypothetical protein [Zhihengliuella halotolerans]|uniref:hypothetical protein n=1 Tax=Zhihengliuella halotolerans TaxID=370736 RepID=UPI000C80AB20|nr:hypothetical protein [Zhihengliuella halotolerans]